MADLVKPIYIYIYDKDNKKLATVSSDIAKNYLDPNEVKENVDNLETVIADGLSTISTAIASEALPEAETALVVEDTKTDELFDEVTNALTDGTITTSLNEGIDEIYNISVTKHNEIQEKFNDDARTEANNYEGKATTREVTRVA